MTAAHHGKAFHGGEHYENFPVGSWLVPARMRKAVLALYRFARSGDDLADEGDAHSSLRIQGLNALIDGLHRQTNDHHPELAAIGSELRTALDEHGVPMTSARDLIDAFLQDAAHQPMQTEADVLAYCRCSANPIGRLVLQLAGMLDASDEPAAIAQASDAVCTGLQLANFAQDMGQDVSRGRIYVPAQWLAQMGIDGIDRADHDMRARLAHQMACWASDKLNEGAILPRLMRKTAAPYRFRLALEVALAIEGGREIARQVKAHPGAVWRASPHISKARLAMVVLRALRTL